MSTQHAPFLETADRIGRRLCRDALWAGTRCNWTGWSMEPIGGAWTPAYRAFGPDLYGGTAGIGLFLARLYRFTGDAHQKSALEGALNQALSRLGTLDDAVKVGFYAGLTGIAYTLIEVGQILEHDALVRQGLDALDGLKTVAPDERMIDVIGGSAGAIPALLDVARRFDRPDFVELAARHGEHLLRLADRAGEGWSWDTMHVPGQRHLTGHSHGVAGILTALLELYQATGQQTYREAALGGLRYERAHFSPQHGNWPDFRQMNPGAPPAPPGYTLAWCHGAPGIGLSRLRTYHLLDKDPDVLQEIEVALRTTGTGLAYPVVPGQGNYSLCHGGAGNAELMLLAADLLDRPQLRQTAEVVGQNGITQFSQPDAPWPCGLMQGGETPNLMLGLAGIGYFYLRLYDPAAVPSILLIQPQA